MLKSLILLPMMLVAGFIACAVAGALFLPLLALVPGLIALCAGLFAVVAAIAIFVFVVRLVAAVLIGVGGLMIGLFALLFFFAGGGILLFALGAAIAHLVVPVLLICGLVWLIRHASKTPPRAPASTALVP
ncbi:MAG TPA: hypothetical protein VFB32_11665 [Rudaea sp.]|nr:hypothetical protein [Rudaea sp.]